VIRNQRRDDTRYGARWIQPCGTAAAIARHRYRHEPLDDICRAARAAARRAGGWPPPDAFVDDVAVERAIDGEDVPLTRLERAEAVRQMARRGFTRSQVAKRLRMSGHRVNQLFFDQAVVDRVIAGDDVQMTSAERAEAVRQMAALGYSRWHVRCWLRMSGQQVNRFWPSPITTGKAA